MQAPVLPGMVVMQMAMGRREKSREIRLGRAHEDDFCYTPLLFSVFAGIRTHHSFF